MDARPLSQGQNLTHMRTLLAIVVIVVGLVLCLGGYITLQGVRNVVRASQSRRWPTTTGTVASADTSRTVSTSHPDRHTTIDDVTYSTHTVIRYRAAGHDYTTNVLFFGQTLGSSDPSEAELLRLRYPSGATVPISYDPAQPWLAVMRPGIHPEVFVLPAAGLAFSLPCLLVFYVLPAWKEALTRQPRFGTASPGIALVPAAFGFLFVALGLLALGAGISRIWNGHASERWPTTLGEVVFAKVESSETFDRETGTVSNTYAPTFVYRYQVNGIDHFNNLRRFGRIEGAGEDWAAEIAARYPVGTRLPVAYFPTDPDVAVLETGNDSQALWMPGVGLVVLLFGAAVFRWVVPGMMRG